MATSYLRLIPNTNYDVPGASAGWITFTGNSGAELITLLQNGSLSLPVLNNDKKNAFRPNLDFICTGGCDYNGGISSWTPNLRNVLRFDFGAQTDLDTINNLLVGKTVEMILIANITISGITFDFPLFYFYKENFPLLTSSARSVISQRCLTEIPNWGTGTFNCNNHPSNINQITSVKSYNFNISEGSTQECDDLRSSLGTSEFFITLNGRDVELNQKSVHYNLLIQPDSSHTSGDISLSSEDGIYTSFYKYDGASVRMLDSVCCHDVGYIEIYGDIEIVGFGINEVADVLVPVPRTLSRQDVLLLRANFDDECCCYATGYTDEVSDIINNFMSGYSSYDAKSEILSAITPKRIRWVGFGRLNEFCCDDSDCTEINEHQFQIELPEPSSGGGDSVDISCICDNLSLINDTLSAFRTDNKNALDSINSTLSGLNIELDNECICDNLESIKDSLGAIKGSIDDKDLLVDNNITVEPCSPIVTNPVNNITVQPSNPAITVEPCTPNITVEPCSPIVTNPVNNITVQPSNPAITVEPCTPSIVNNVQTDVQDIVDKLDELLKSDDKTITDILKDKEMGSNIDVEVSPADDVNINRVYYTNQRNGDTNI